MYQGSWLVKRHHQDPGPQEGHHASCPTQVHMRPTSSCRRPRALLRRRPIPCSEPDRSAEKGRRRGLCPSCESDTVTPRGVFPPPLAAASSDSVRRCRGGCALAAPSACLAPMPPCVEPPSLGGRPPALAYSSSGTDCTDLREGPCKAGARLEVIRAARNAACLCTHVSPHCQHPCRHRQRDGRRWCHGKGLAHDVAVERAVLLGGGCERGALCGALPQERPQVLTLHVCCWSLCTLTAFWSLPRLHAACSGR